VCREALSGACNDLWDSGLNKKQDTMYCNIKTGLGALIYHSSIKYILKSGMLIGNAEGFET
jgi:hypothetical protein